jgi:hypothetical protein
MVFEDNLALRQLLSQAEIHASALGVVAALAGSLRQHLRVHPAASVYFDLELAAAENQAHQELLTRIIQAFGQISPGSDNAEQRDFRTAMRAYLGQLLDQEFQLVEAAANMSPV